MIVYLDTSAALKLLVAEDESEALVSALNGLAAEDALVSSMLLFTELHCAARRRVGVISQSAVDQVLNRIELVDLARADLQRAALSDWGLRSADAIHLACALRVEADLLVAYDRELLAAATRQQLEVESPGVRPGRRA